MQEWRDTCHGRSGAWMPAWYQTTRHVNGS
jgi:hypothetical protein